MSRYLPTLILIPALLVGVLAGYLLRPAPPPQPETGPPPIAVPVEGMPAPDEVTPDHLRPPMHKARD